MLSAAVLWQVYEISGSALQLGLIGIARFIPSLIGSLIGGAAADTIDRKKLIIASQSVPLSVAFVLFLATRTDVISLPLIYGLVSVLTLAMVLGGPARQAMLPSIVAPERLGRAVTITTTLGSLARISGPALAGVLIGWFSTEAAYGVCAALILLAVLAFLPLHPRPFNAPKRSISVAVIREGLAFVWSRQILVGIMALDLVAVIFGGATALLPIFAAEVLHVGPRGYGLLAASVDVGAVVMSTLMIFMPQVERAGRALFLSIFAFGIATVIFGISEWFIVSFLAYVAVGMADQASVVMRVTTIQLVTPHELQGRVHSVNFLFAISANELGAVESGLAAVLIGAPLAVVTGGIACLGALGFIAVRTPELRRYTITSSVEESARVST